MAATTPPPPPGAAPGGGVNPAKKKGLHPLAWVGIGCLVIVVLGGIAILAGGMFVASKAKEMIGEGGDPAMVAAEMIVRMSPELELVDSDHEAGTLTVRSKETGEEATVDLSEIESGNFSFESDGKEVTIDGSGAADGGSIVSVTEEGPDGETESVLQIGSGSASSPDWAAPYPGTEAQSLYSMSQGGIEQGSYQISTTDDFEKVIAYYEALADELGYEIDRSTVEAGGQRVATIATRNANEEPGFNAVIQDQGGERQVVFTYRQPTE